MEAIGFAASVTALITITAQVGTLLSTYISEVRDAPEVLSNLLSEISSLTTVITNLKGTIDSDVFKNKIEKDLLTGYKAEHWRFVKKAIEDCSKTLESLKSEWETDSEAQRVTKRPRLVQMAITRFKLRTEESRIRSYRLRVLTAKDAIQISLMIISVASQFEMQDSIDGIGPHLEKTSEKIDRMLNILNERLQNVQLDDDDGRESINIARRVVESASDIFSTVSSTVMTITDRTETQSVMFIDPEREKTVHSWVDSLSSSTNRAPMDLDLSRLGCESILEKGLAAYEENSFEVAEGLLEHYLAVVQSDDRLEADRDKIINAYVQLCRSCLQQGKMEKMHDKLVSASEVAATAAQEAFIYMTRASYFLGGRMLDIPAAKSAWNDAANCLLSHYGSFDKADPELFEQLKVVKLEILRQAADGVEFQFWSTVASLSNLIGNQTSQKNKKPTRSRRLRKANAQENLQIAHAIKNGDLDRIQKLIAEGVNALAFMDRSKETTGYKCLHLAVMAGQEKLTEFFLQNGADANEVTGREMICPLTLAANISDQQLAINIFQLLLQNGAVVRTKGQFALQAAILRGNLEIIRMLIRNDPDADIILNEQGKGNGTMQSTYHDSPLIAASTLDDDNIQLEVVKILVQAGARVNDRGELNIPPFWRFRPTSLSYRYLLENGADTNLVHSVTKTSLLHHGYLRDFSPPTDLIHLIVGRGLDINLVNKGGETPLISAIVNGSHEVALKLIELGCDLTEEFTPPLFYALRHYMNFKQLHVVVSALLDKGCVPDREYVSCYFLHGPIIGRNEPLVERLIKVGLDVNQECENVSPLALAKRILSADHRIITILEENGALD